MSQGLDKWIPVDLRAELMSSIELAIARLPVQSQRLLTNDCTSRELGVVKRWLAVHEPGESVASARELMSSSDLKILDRVERRFRRLLEKHGFDPTTAERVDSNGPKVA